MKKLGTNICDRCRKDIAYSFAPHCWTVRAEKRNLHFCSYKCQLTFFKGKKYWRNKQKILDQIGTQT